MKRRKQERLIEKFEDVSAMNELAALYFKDENYKMASFEDDADAMNSLAAVYMKTSKPKEAEKYFKLAIEKNNVFAMYNLGVLYYILKRYEKSKAYIEMAKRNGFLKK